MNRKIAKILSVLLLLTAIAVTQVPVSDVEAVAPASDFQMEGSKLLKYTGTAEAVSIPADIKSIGEEAFAGNDDLIKVTIEGDVEYIGYRAFAECDNLRTILVGDNVETIDTAAFSNNKELVNVTLGAGVKELGTGVFAGCSQLKDLTLSEDNPYLHYSNGILYDDEETIVYALMPAYEKGAYTLPGTVKEIRGYAFWGNPYLEKVTLGSRLSEVPAYAFSNCMNLKEVEIPLPVRGIGAKAFEDCVNLEMVTLPDSMAQISDSAFDGCPNVQFTATPGTYSAEFAATLQKTEVDEVEYEDVQDSQVIAADEVSGDHTSEESPSPEPTMEVETQTVNNLTLLGQSSIVAGRAMIFIDNGQSNVRSGIDLGQMETAASQGEQTVQSGLEKEQIKNLLADSAQKGKDFPKYTIVNNRTIASQAFYQDSNLTEYQIENGIEEIGEFAFARSALTSIEIPEGVTTIGYGAFYHCDSLEDVTIPTSVTRIEPYAFDKTPWVENTQTATYPFLIVGDGILIAYNGSDSVVNIPSGVKQIGPQVFKDHMGITAVNIPDSVEVICEEAFMGCKNLKTVNGGNGLTRVEDRAFWDCPLSTVRIPASVQEIGLGAYALSGGTDTALFEGETLPSLITGQGVERIANSQYRTYAIGNIRTVIVPAGVSDLKGTVLESETYGFKGIVCDEAGNQIADNSKGVALLAEGSGVTLQLSSERIDESENAMATIPGNDENYILKITDSDEAAEKISAAYGELYGGRTPLNLTAYDISLYDASGSISITRLGKQYVTVQIPVPAGIETQDMHVVTLDQDGQLEALEHRVVEMEDGAYLQITTNHFSPLGIYNYSGFGGQAYVTDGKATITSLSGNKDDTPDTGDPIHPKWFLALGLFAGSVALFFYKGKTLKQIK
ncbi:MAG: leucine-rich repeat domain-containing protein [Lachnospiraceae bacterium]|nr:leucine-rich repeat domain-containing protein [Lachnospiraceae bacterium]